MNIRAFKQSDQSAVIALWDRCDLLRPWNDPVLDIQRKMGTDADGFLVGESDDQLVACIMAGYDGHRGWINYLAVDPRCQGQGLGREMVDAAVLKLESRGCPKINLQIRADNSDVIDFYSAIGFSEDKVVSMGKRLIADD